MKKFHRIGIGVLLALGGCMSQVEREAVSFPDMPKMPVYRRADSRQFTPEQAMDALEDAVSACRKTASGAASPPEIGSPDFDACMRSRGYRRVQ